MVLKVSSTYDSTNPVVLASVWVLRSPVIVIFGTHALPEARTLVARYVDYHVIILYVSIYV